MMRTELECLLREFAGPDAGVITDATTFELLGLDSGDLVDLVLHAERFSRVRLSDFTLAQLVTFGDLVAAIDDARTRRAGPVSAAVQVTA